MIARRAWLVLVVLAASFALPAAAAATTPGANGRIVFSTRDARGNQELYSVAPDGTGVTQLTWSWTNLQYPAWSPDGSQIAFASFADGPQSIHVMNADGSNERRVSPEGQGVDDAEPTWSPDGSQIAFSSSRSSVGWNVWVVNADGTGARPLVTEFSTGPAWSPDGSRIAFLSMGGSISVANADGTDAQQLTFPPSSHVDERPSWSPDGSRLVFARRTTYGNDPQLYLVDAGGGNERQLTFGDGVSRFPAWSPDGAQIVFTYDRQVSVIGADGSGMRPLLDWWGESLSPDWGTSTAVPVPQPPGAPTIQIFSPEPRLYPAGYEVPAIYFCESATSFVVSCEGDVPLGSLVDMETTGNRTFTVRATDAEGRTSTKTATFEVLDWREPTVVVRTPADGAEYGLGEVVQVDYECVDELGGSGIWLCDGELQPGWPLDTSRLGSFTVHFWAVDQAHNVAEVSVTYSVVDRTPPTVTIETPPEGALYVLGESVVASYSCEDAVSCRGDVAAGALLDTSSVGAKTFTVTAKDLSHNVANLSRGYHVVYPFSGFGSPLEASGFATLKAGDKVPVKFTLGGDWGLGVVTGSTWTRVSCGVGTPLSDSSSVLAAGRLSYHGGRYHYQVETDASWAGSCRQLAVTLDDGTTHFANVSFD